MLALIASCAATDAPPPLRISDQSAQFALVDVEVREYKPAFGRISDLVVGQHLRWQVVNWDEGQDWDLIVGNYSGPEREPRWHAHDEHPENLFDEAFITSETGVAG